jgi:DNA-binding transcriptional ArsR family regulator
MGTWQISADLLARSRFVLSPLAEVTGTLGALMQPVDADERALAAGHREAFTAMLDGHPPRREVLRFCSRPGWLADFLTLPPTGPDATIESQLDQIRARGDRRVRADLREVAGERPLPSVLRRPGVADHAADLLEWVWSHTVAADWARRERVLRADIVSRTSRLATQGWAAVLRDLGSDRDWLGDGRLRINRHDNPPRELEDDADLFFIPVHARGTWVGWDIPHTYAVYYPVTGALAEVGGRSADGLSPLLGRNRARILSELNAPASTSHLVTRTGLPLGTVGGQLRVLLDAGLVLRRRSGREVLYWRTALGDTLVAAGTS